MTAYGAQLQGLYSANVPTVNLTLAVLALVWVAYDYWQEVKASRWSIGQWKAMRG